MASAAPAPSSPGKRRRATEQAEALVRVQELALVANQNAPEPQYLDRPRPSSASAQPIISERQREKVVKYINELAEDFELCVQTGTLACNYFDRYIATLTGSSQAPTADKRLIQMIASTCLLIAAKFSDRKLPPLSELEKVHHGKVQADEFAELELKILQALRWKLHVPLPHAFIEHMRSLCTGAPFTPTIEDRMLFFIDLSVYGYHFLSYSHAAIAAAAILVAWKFSDEHEAVKTHLERLANAVALDPRQLTACVNALVRYYQSCFPEAADKQDHSGNLFLPIPSDEKVDASGADAPLSDTPSLLRCDAPGLGAESPRPPSTEPQTPTADGDAVRADQGAASKAPMPGTQADHRATPDSVLEVGRVDA